jgi:hypothetical protein
MILWALSTSFSSLTVVIVACVSPGDALGGCTQKTPEGQIVCSRRRGLANGKPPK